MMGRNYKAKTQVGIGTDSVCELCHDVCKLHMIGCVFMQHLPEYLLKIVAMRRRSLLDAGYAEQGSGRSASD